MGLQVAGFLGFGGVVGGVKVWGWGWVGLGRYVMSERNRLVDKLDIR